MKRTNGFILCVVLVSIVSGIGAQNPDWLWVSPASAENAQAITICNGGNSYVTGSFSGTETFGDISLTSSGSDDVYAAKLDGNGNFVWAVKAGGDGDDCGYDIAVDSLGDLYVTGYFSGVATFGTTTLTSSGGTDLFAAKLNNSGAWLWAVNAGGSEEDLAYGIAVDSASNAYLTGRFAGTAAFGDNSLTSFGFNDIFAAKLGTNGNWLWAVKAGGNNQDDAHGIAVDANADVYLTGTFRYTATFGTISATCTGWNDVFAAKLDTDGNWLWIANGGGDSSYADAAYGIAVDSEGFAYLTGDFFGTAAFGSSIFTSNGGKDIYVAKLDANGNWLWADKAGGTATDSGLDIALDSNSNAYLTGYFQDTIELGSLSLTGNGLYDIFFAKLDANGNWLWAEEAGSSSNDDGRSIALDANDNIYLHGVFSGIASFGGFSFTSVGFDVFIAKLSPGDTGSNDELTPQHANLSWLSEAWPNPAFQGIPIHIKAGIASGETGCLSVFNVRGQGLASYQLGFGTHLLEFDSSDLPSGIYFYQLKTQTTSLVKKVILVR